MKPKVIKPPTFSKAIALKAICSCLEWSSRPKCGLQFLHFSGCFLMVPSPLHGTSQMMRSYRAGVGNSCALCCTTATAAAAGCDEHRRANTQARLALSSLAMTAPSPANSKACSVFEPGAAQRSSTTWPRSMPNMATGTVLTTSCRETLPSAEHLASHSPRRDKADFGFSCCSCRKVLASQPNDVVFENGNIRGAGTNRPLAVVQPSFNSWTVCSTEHRPTQMNPDESKWAYSRRLLPLRLIHLARFDVKKKKQIAMCAVLTCF